MEEEEQQREQSRNKTSKKKKIELPISSNMQPADILSIGEDLLQIILSKLPAKSFASANCTCRTFHRLSTRILSRPKLLSSVSLKPNLQVAIEEASEKALSEPIRPHFAIAFIGRRFNLKDALELIRAKVGRRIPVVCCLARGIIGRDAVSNELREVKWNVQELCEMKESYNSSANVDRGIVLTVGFLPGLKVSAIPLMKANEKSQQGSIVESFLSNIKTYTASVSNTTSPLAIVMIADHDSDTRSVLEKMDYTLGGETIITGDERGYFLFSNGDDGNQELSQSPSSSRRQCRNAVGQTHIFDAVALVFAKDRHKTHGSIGEIRFDLAVSIGLSPAGPTYKAASVRVTQNETSECCTWLTATREGSVQRLDGQTILSDLEDEVVLDNLNGDFYIGVTKQRKRSSKSRRGRYFSSFIFREVIGGDDEYLFVEDKGIRTGDIFRFYFPNVETALASCNDVSRQLRSLKNSGSQHHHPGSVVHDGNKLEVFGGLMFTCYGRGESFFGEPDVDTSVFSANFPGVPLGGMFCTGEIGRCASTKQNTNQLNPSDSSLHVYSSTYMVMSYSPKS